MTGLVETIKGLLKAWFAEPTNYGTMFDTVVNVMKFTDSGTSSINDASILTALINVTAPIAMVLMVIYFLISLFSGISNEKEPDLHVFVKAGIVLLIADLCLTHSPELLGNLMGLSNTFLMQMRDTVGELSSQTFELDANWSLIGLIIMLLFSAFGKIISIIASAIIFIVCASAKIELIVRLAFAPIGFATIAGEGRPGDSLRFLKKLFASCFYCGAIVVAMYISCALTTTMINPISESSNYLAMAIGYIVNSVYTFAMPLAAAGAISTAKSIINESFGV